VAIEQIAPGVDEAGVVLRVIQGAASIASSGNFYRHI
jgi:hypothetical protein